MKPILGKELNDQPTSLMELVSGGEERQNITIEGRISGYDKIENRNGGFRHVGVISDGTNSIYFIVFEGGNGRNPNQFTNALENQMYIRAKGKFYFNDRQQGNPPTIMFDQITDLEKPIVRRKCEAQEKREELSFIGPYSPHISSTPMTEYAKAIKEMGFRGFVLTDINSFQGAPEAYQIAKKLDLKLILGAKLSVAPTKWIVFGKKLGILLKNGTYVVLDVETTGLSMRHDHVIEIGAVKVKNGEIIDRFQCFVKSPKKISETITNLTRITQEMVDEHGISLEEAIKKFENFIGDSILVAQNAEFDLGMLIAAFAKVGKKLQNGAYTMIDTLGVSRLVNKDFLTHGLKVLSKKYDVELDGHHRADIDAEATAKVWMKMIVQLEENGVTNIDDIHSLIDDAYHKATFNYEETFLIQNEIGLRNLQELISLAHTDHMSYVAITKSYEPQLPEYIVEKYQEGLLRGSGSSRSFLFESAVNKSDVEVEELVQKYDYIEIEPVEVGMFSLKTEAEEQKMYALDAWNSVIKAAKKYGKTIVATGNVHYIEADDFMSYHHLLKYNRPGIPQNMRKNQRLNKNESRFRHLRTTQEMLDAFDWLNEEEKYEFVVTNTRNIFDSCEMINPIPEGFFPPIVEGAPEKLEKDAYDKAYEVYGNPLPELVKARLEKEIKSIVGNGFSVIYSISQDLVLESLANGYLVGSRGSVGSSFVATMTSITEVNPLEPHYVCPSCKWSVFFNTEELGSGYDLPRDFKVFSSEKYNNETKKHVYTKLIEQFGKDRAKQIVTEQPKDTCPSCGHEGLKRDGQNIPFETFLGFKGDKVPDIDLNFSGDYQPKAHRYILKRFGEDNCFRAGTIGTVATKTAFGYALKYSEEQLTEEEQWTTAEASRHATHMEGSKRTTGQHPGGIIVIQEGRSINEFGGCNFPANNYIDKESGEPNMRTTHYAYSHIHDNCAKFDILGHDDPTVLYLLKEWTGIDPKTVDFTHPKVMALFSDVRESLGINPQDIQIGNDDPVTGTLGIPEFGTKFVRQMIVDTKPTTYDELVKISGLSHGTDVWLGNAQKLIKDGTCTLRSVIDTRDNIMVYLIQKKMEPSLAFKIMEFVRKGNGPKPGSQAQWEEYQQVMREHDVPEWYIWSCGLIKYMFPKAHAAAYVLSALRIAWYKVFYPIQYYAAQLSVRWMDTDISEVLKPTSELRQRIIEISKDPNASAKDQDMIVPLHNILEAKVRGIDFANIRLYQSHGIRWLVDNNKIVPPFVTIPGLGEKVALKLQAEADAEIFKGEDDLQKRGGVSKNPYAVLQSLGALEMVTVKDHSFF